MYRSICVAASLLLWGTFMDVHLDATIVDSAGLALKLSRTGGKTGEARSHIGRLVGRRMRDRRMSLGLTEKTLADELRILPSDVVLYEKGAKRLSAELLLRIARTLSVAPTYLLAGSGPGGHFADQQTPHEAPRVPLSLADQGQRLNRAFFSVGDPARREAIVALVVEIARREKEELGAAATCASQGEAKRFLDESTGAQAVSV